MTKQPALLFNHVSRHFGASTALNDVSLNIPEGSFTALLGASGCGKSTSLRIMAGLDRPSKGEVLLNGKQVTEKTAYERNIAMVFQSYALYPHLTVFQNIALPLTMRHLSALGRLPLIGSFSKRNVQSKKYIVQKVGETAESLGLSGFLNRKPSALSGGQKQRVALGRALVRDPALFLFDEPLSNLDARLRVKMRSELVALHKRTERPFVYVTHDQTEAMAMADQIIVMMDGKVAQTGSPRDLYHQPSNMKVAAFIGHNSMNFLEPGDDVGSFVQGIDQTIGIRPEHLIPDPKGALSAKLQTVEYLGSEIVLNLRTSNGKAISAIAPDDYQIPIAGTDIKLGVSKARIHHFHHKTGERVNPEALKGTL